MILTPYDVLSRFDGPRPTTALILGSGLGYVCSEMEVQFEAAFTELQDIPASSVPGHKGKLEGGIWEDTPLWIARGRCHLYEGCTAKAVTAMVRFLHEMGVRRLVLTNAAGCVNAHMSPGHWMLLTDQLNLTGQSPLTGAPNFLDMSDIYSQPWRAKALEATANNEVLAYTGVYAGLPGPQFETPAEVRMLQTMGADAVGMSTVLEAIQAKALEMDVLGMSCLTNWGAGMTSGELTHEEVLETGSHAMPDLVKLLRAALA